MTECSCKFNAPELVRHSAAWSAAHKAHHLATYPNVDQTTISNLDGLIEWAEMMEVPDPELITCAAPGCSGSFFLVPARIHPTLCFDHAAVVA